MSASGKSRLVVGRFYRVRGGEKVLLVDMFKFSCLVYSYEAQKLIRLNNDGRQHPHKPDFWDIVARWADSPEYMEILDDGIAKI